jgi:hypothetical protein
VGRPNRCLRRCSGRGRRFKYQPGRPRSHQCEVAQWPIRNPRPAGSNQFDGRLLLSLVAGDLQRETVYWDGDVILNSKQSLSFKSFYSRDPESLPFQASTNVLGFGENDYHSNLNLALSYTYVINSSTVNQLRIGYSRNYVDQVPVNPFTATSLGMTPPTSLNGTPSFLISGLFELGTNRNNNQLIRQHEGRSAIHSANPWDVINSGLAAAILSIPGESPQGARLRRHHHP